MEAVRDEACAPTDKRQNVTFLCLPFSSITSPPALPATQPTPGMQPTELIDLSPTSRCPGSPLIFLVAFHYRNEKSLNWGLWERGCNAVLLGMALPPQYWVMQSQEEAVRDSLTSIYADSDRAC